MRSKPRLIVTQKRDPKELKERSYFYIVKSAANTTYPKLGEELAERKLNELIELGFEVKIEAVK